MEVIMEKDYVKQAQEELNEKHLELLDTNPNNNLEFVLLENYSYSVIKLHGPELTLHLWWSEEKYDFITDEENE